MIIIIYIYILICFVWMYTVRIFSWTCYNVWHVLMRYFSPFAEARPWGTSVERLAAEVQCHRPFDLVLAADCSAWGFADVTLHNRLVYERHSRTPKKLSRLKLLNDYSSPDVLWFERTQSVPRQGEISCRSVPIGFCSANANSGYDFVTPELPCSIDTLPADASSVGASWWRSCSCVWTSDHTTNRTNCGASRLKVILFWTCVAQTNS